MTLEKLFMLCQANIKVPSIFRKNTLLMFACGMILHYKFSNNNIQLTKNDKCQAIEPGSNICQAPSQNSELFKRYTLKIPFF